MLVVFFSLSGRFICIEVRDYCHYSFSTEFPLILCFLGLTHFFMFPYLHADPGFVPVHTALYFPKHIASLPVSPHNPHLVNGALHCISFSPLFSSRCLLLIRFLCLSGFFSAVPARFSSRVASEQQKKNQTFFFLLDP